MTTNKKRKVLIIKTGFSEFLDRGISTIISLGDVLMCTSILSLYKNDHVTWVTSFKGSPLLHGNPYIHDLLIFSPTVLQKIAQSSCDILINLEKDIGICSFLRTIKAKEKYGFYFDTKLHDIATYNRSAQCLLDSQENHKAIHKSTLAILFETVGGKWQGEVPYLRCPSGVAEKYDIGFNFAVGTKWPTKAWPMHNWQALEKILQKKYSISWQKGHTNIKEYIRWIQSCRLIVTCDSLGQIVGQALNKKVVTLFGPTNHERMTGIPGTEVIASTLKCPYRPCFLPFCRHKKYCMDYITPKRVAAVCQGTWPNSHAT